MGRPTQSRRDLTPSPAATRAALLRAGATLFERVGYESITVDDIRRSAGVSRGTFYFYFRDRRHLFLEVAKEQVRETYDLYHRRYPDADDYGRIIFPHIVYFEIWSRRARIMAQIFSLSLDDPDFAELRRNAHGRVSEMMGPRLERLATAGRLAATTMDVSLLPPVLDALLEGFANRVFLDAGDGESRLPFPDVVRATAEAWYRLLYAKPAPYRMSDDVIAEFRAKVAAELDATAPSTSARAASPD